MFNRISEQTNLPIYTTKQFHAKLEAEVKSGPTVKIDGKRLKMGNVAMIMGVKVEEFDGAPCLIVYHAKEDGEQFGVIIDRQYAEELVAVLGPHPLVEKFFKLN